MQRKDIKKLAIMVQLVILLVIPQAIAESPPAFPMSIYGEVINTDTSEKAPLDTTVMVKTDTGEVITDKVDQNGYYGEPANERLLVPECNSYEVSISLDENEINLGSHPWKSGDIKRLDLKYSVKNQEGSIEEDKTSTGSTSGSTSGSGGGGGGGAVVLEQTNQEQEQGVQNSQTTQDNEPEPTTTTKNDVESGDDGVESGTPSASTTQEKQPQDQQLWQQPTSLVFIAASAIIVVAIAIYLTRK